ncbi:MAG: mercuric reductase [Gemmatimonadaceae bacterium]
MADYDLIAVGGGTAGLVVAAGAAGLGARVALIERHRLGGECLWSGCVPSKALLACARTMRAARDGAAFGIDVSGVAVDFARVMAYVQGAQAMIAPHDSPDRFRALGVDVIEGEARFTGARTLAVGGRTVTARRVVIATGSRPAVPPVPGLRDVPFLTNETIFALTELPRHLMILGAGPIGLEMAQAFARLGSRVSVVEVGNVLLPREDEEAANVLARVLEGDGVAMHLGATVTSVTRQGGDVALAVRHADGTTRQVVGDALLVAAGRKANIEALDLPVAGVLTGPEGVIVDERLATTAEGVWASGDVTGGLRFTHVADYESRIIIRNAFFPFPAKRDYSVVPWVTFTDPEIAHVGLTEREARARHGEGVRVWRRPYDDVDRAIVDGETTGFVKIVTDSRGRILGGHIVAHGAGNLIPEVALAMRSGIGIGDLSRVIHAYPTLPEAIRQAGDLYYKSKFTGVAKRIAGWLVRH